MFDAKFICTVLAIGITIAAVCHMKDSTKEGFWGNPSRTARTFALSTNPNTGETVSLSGFGPRGTPGQVNQSIASVNAQMGTLPGLFGSQGSGVMGTAGAAASGQAAQTAGVMGPVGRYGGQPTHHGNQELYEAPSGSYEGYGNNNNTGGMPFFQPAPSFQSQLSPRFSSEGYGRDIRYNMPAQRHLGVDPSDPLMHAKLAQNPGSVENFGCNGCSAPACSKAGDISQPPKSVVPMMHADYSVPYYQEALSQGSDESGHSIPVLSDPNLPVGNMASVGANGEVLEPYISNRLMYANAPGRGVGQGDPIRGDLPIVPCNTGWFQVAADPSTMLQKGAMNVLFGDGTVVDAANKLALNSTMNTVTTVGGTDIMQPGMNEHGELVNMSNIINAQDLPMSATVTASVFP